MDKPVIGYHLKKYLLPVVIFISALVVFLNQYKTHYFFIDEYIFTSKAYYFDLYVNRNFSDLRWYSWESGGDVTQPKLGTYIYGINMHLNHIDNIDTHLGSIQYGSGEIDGTVWWKYLSNKKLIFIPPDYLSKLEIIWSARKVSILFSALALTFFFLFSRSVGGTFCGVIASLILLNNPLVYLEARHAATDSMQLFAFFLTLYLFQKWYASIFLPRANKLITYSALIGLSTAFAASVKTIGILSLSFIIVANSAVVFLNLKHRTIVLRVAIGTCLTILITCVIFYVLNPYLYSDTFNHLKDMYLGRVETYSQYWIETPETAITSRLGAVGAIFRHTLFSKGEYTNFPLFNRIPMDFLLVYISFFYLIYKLFKKNRSPKFKVGIYSLLLWSIIVLVSLILYLKNDWSRYYLPWISCLTLIEAYGISAVISGIISRPGLNINILSGNKCRKIN